jgi:hypothetical protein
MGYGLKVIPSSPIKIFVWIGLANLFLAACSAPLPPTAIPTPIITPTTAPVRPSPLPSQTLTLTPTKNTPQPVLTATLTLEAAGCLKPPDDYTLVRVNGWTLNQRTLTMLQQAARIYHGEIQITGRSITQGSFHDEPGGYGTHAGGGVLDISVMRPGTYTILYADIPDVIHALRLAGFAAWLREPDELYDGSPIHIHAVAIGDRTLSPAAQAQVTGPTGYFKGYASNPAPGKTLALDRYGGPIICQWMKDAGYP